MSDLSVSGLGSGIDWKSIIDKLRQVEEQKITTLTNQQQTQQNKLTAWQAFNTKISALQTASADLKASSAFDLFTASLTSSSAVAAESILSVTASSGAAKGSYEVIVDNEAKAEKLASASFTSQTSALGVSGTILINGQALTINAGDTLQSVRSAINSLNSGDTASKVTAAIVKDSPNSYRLVLTSEREGAAGMSLQNGSSTDTLSSLGFNASGTAIKNKVTGAALSDRFTSSTTSVEALLGIEAQNLSGTVTINGKSAAIDLSSTLEGIRDALNGAGLNAQIVTETEGTTTYSRLKIEGMTSGTDDSNVLQAIGLLEGNRADVTGVTSGVANTTDGTTPISSSTLITDIYGYLANSPGDKITISGTTHDGTAVTATDFNISGASTVGDLLAAVQTQFGNVTATLTTDGKIQVIDNATGTSQLSVDLDSTLTDTDAGWLDFGAFTEVGAVRKYVLQQGEDAAFRVDGMSMTSTSNTVTDAIAGLTLDLKGEAPDTAITVDVDEDGEAIEEKIKKLVDAYNGVLDFINGQMKYNADTKQTGGPLFGDNILKSIKMSMQSTMLAPIGSGGVKYLTDMGFKIGSDNKLSYDSDVLQAKIKTNFDDIVHFFTDVGSSADRNFQFVYSSGDTKVGTYAIDITQAPGPGVDIAGTIDGKAAVGHGSTLSLNDPTSSANGLVIQYLGTLPTTTSFTYTRGFANVFETQIDGLTNTVDGTLTSQQKGIQSSIDALDKKISTTQDQINRRMAVLARQFQAMDTAMAQMLSLQSYLTSQIAAMNKSTTSN